MARPVLNHSNAPCGPFDNRASLGIRRSNVGGWPDDCSAGQVANIEARIHDRLSLVFCYMGPEWPAQAASA